MYSVYMCHYVYTWDTITRASVVMVASLKCTLALGSSLTTAAHIICFALSAYLKNKQTVRIQCRLKQYTMSCISHTVCQLWMSKEFLSYRRGKRNKRKGEEARRGEGKKVEGRGREGKGRRGEGGSHLRVLSVSS